jgi:hypothetical protein
MLVSSDVAVANVGVTSMSTDIGLINVAAAETVGVMVAKPPLGRFNTDVAVTLGVTVEAIVADLTACIAADTTGEANTATMPTPA